MFKISPRFLAVTLAPFAALLMATSAHAFSGFGSQVQAACDAAGDPVKPSINLNDCATCHGNPFSGKNESNVYFTAYNMGDYAEFCPTQVVTPAPEPDPTPTPAPTPEPTPDPTPAPAPNPGPIGGGDDMDDMDDDYTDRDDDDDYASNDDDDDDWMDDDDDMDGGFGKGKGKDRDRSFTAPTDVRKDVIKRNRSDREQRHSRYRDEDDD